MNHSDEMFPGKSDEALKSYQWNCLVGGLAHELSNKIVPVLGFTSLLAANPARMTEEKRVDTLKSIQASAEEASFVIKTLLQLSKRPPAHDEICDLRVLSRDSLEFLNSEILAEGDGTFVDRSMEWQGPIVISADTDQIRQAIINLLLYVAEIEALRRDEKGSWNLHVGADSDVAILTVENLSGGEKDLAELFDGERDETGPELSVCTKLIERLGGSVEAARQAGGGSAIRMCIPLHKAEETEVPDETELVTAPIAIEKSAEDLDQLRILVVDDEPFIIQILSYGIEDELGCQVETAENGRTAIEKLKNGAFDLVVSDVRMPDLDGFDLFAWVVKNHHSLASRFLFITGDTGSVAMDERLSEVPAPVLRKPFVIGEISRECRRLLTPHGQN